MVESPKIQIVAEKVFAIFGLPVTNAMLMSWLVAVILIIVSLVGTKKIKAVPNFLQNVFEMMMEMFTGFMEGIMGSRQKAEKYVPVVVTFFLFILLCNWAGVFPGVGSIVLHEGGETVPLFRSAASDLNFTLMLAIVAVLAVNFLAIRAVGLKVHVARYINFKGPIEFFVGILELVSEIARVISFSFRLFGNIFAGEVLMIIMAFLMPFVAPIPFIMLEFFVGFIQALVFSMLVIVFLSIATTEHHA